MVQCGYEPSATLGLHGKPGDTWKNIWFNFGPRPRPKNNRPDPKIVFNGVSAAASRPMQESTVVRG
jgi:hypothetical protein